MEGGTEYRDTWRGLRLFVPRGWLVRRSGPGLFLHDPTGERVAVIQPRVGATSIASLEGELLAWLRRFDPQAELNAEPDGASEVRACTARLHVNPEHLVIGVFALEVRAGGGLISGFLGPALSYEADGRSAIGALSSLEPMPALSRHPWDERAEKACGALLPRGWRAEAHIRRNNPRGVASVDFQARADDTVRVMVDTTGRLFMEPGLLNRILSALAHGLVRQGRFMDAGHYAEAYLLPALRREAPDACIAEIVARPDVASLAVAQEAASTGLRAQDILEGQPSGADVLFAFHVGGRPVRQIRRVVTMRLPQSVNRGLPLWMASTLLSYQAPEDRLAEWEPVLEGVGQSFRLNPEWDRKERARISRQASSALRLGQPVAGTRPRVDEAERVACDQVGLRLGLHERPFLPCAGPEMAHDDDVSPVSGLYEGPIWQQVQTQVV